MNVTVLVNSISDVGMADTTTNLAATAANRGHRVQFVGLGDLIAYADRRIGGNAVVLGGARRWTSNDVIDTARNGTLERVSLSSEDVLLMRTNPARDPGRAWAQEEALGFAQALEHRGVLVLNSPDGLRRTASKRFITELPADVIPETLVTRDLDQIRRYVTSRKEPTVLKPARGSRGYGVFLVRPPDFSNMTAIAEILATGGYVMAQAYVPDAVDGDTRVVVVDGAPLTVDGQIAAARRIPGPGEFRSNVHAGGSAVPANLSPTVIKKAHQVARRLKAEGIFIAGLDFVGDRVVEINVHATGGLGAAERFYGHDYFGAVIEHIERARATQ